MTFEADYLRAKNALREINELTRKVTTKARHRIAAKTIRAQLEAHMDDLRNEFGTADQSDIAVAFEADRLPSPKGWDTPS